MENTIEPGLENQNNVKLKHSGLGIASFIIAVISAILIFTSFGILACGEKVYPETAIPKDVFQPIVVMALLFGSFLSFVGLGLSIAGLIVKGRKKLFSILGLVITLTLFLGAVLVLIIAVLSNMGVI